MYARAVAKAIKENGGRKPFLRRLTARINRYDYRLDLDNRVLILKIRNDMEVKLKLLVLVRESRSSGSGAIAS